MWTMVLLACALCPPCEREVEARRSALDEDGWAVEVEDWTRTYTCGTDERIATMTETLWLGYGHVASRSWNVSTYDDDERLAAREWFEVDEGGVRSRRWTYTYDEEGRLLHEDEGRLLYEDEGDDGEVVERATRFYDDEGCLVRREFDRELDGDLDGLETSVCDDQGRVIAIDVSWNGGSVIDERLEYSYDDRDRVIQQWHADRWGTTLADYTWDRKDRLETEHWAEDDEADGHVDEVSDYTWDYDERCVE